MAGRGEDGFVGMLRFGARLYARLMSSRATAARFDDMARDLVAVLPRGRLLDVGCGPGTLLAAVHALAPPLDICGLDVSRARVDLATDALGDAATVRHGNVTAIPWEDRSFALVCCSGRFYLWNEPVRGLAEIHRALRPGGRAVLYETTRDCDLGEVRAAMRRNLRHDPPWIRLLAPRFVLRQRRVTCREAEVGELVANRPFGVLRVERVALGGPAWMRVELGG